VLLAEEPEPRTLRSVLAAWISQRILLDSRPGSATSRRFRGWKARCQLEARVEVPSIGFTWKSDAIETSRADFALIGEEANGKHYLQQQ